MTRALLNDTDALDAAEHPLTGEVGRPVLRYGGADRTTGAQRFVADIAFTGAAHVALVTIPSSCAAILALVGAALPVWNLSRTPVAGALRKT